MALGSHKIERVRQKYPDLLVDGNFISLHKVGYYLSVYNMLERDGRYDQMRIIGLIDFKSDLKWILTWEKEERRKKIQRLNEINEKI